MATSNNKINNRLMLILVLVPIISIATSFIHIITFASITNSLWMAVAISLAFELGAVFSFLFVSKGIVGKDDLWKVMTVMIILFLLQIVGNVYAGFDYATQEMIKNPHFLDTIREITFNYFRLPVLKLAISALLGMPLPIISLFMLGFSLNYIAKNNDSNDETKVDTVDTELKQDNKNDEQIKSDIDTIPDVPNIDSDTPILDMDTIRVDEREVSNDDIGEEKTEEIIEPADEPVIEPVNEPIKKIRKPRTKKVVVTDNYDDSTTGELPVKSKDRISSALKDAVNVMSASDNTL